MSVSCGDVSPARYPFKASENDDKNERKKKKLPPSKRKMADVPSGPTKKKTKTQQQAQSQEQQQQTEEVLLTAPLLSPLKPEEMEGLDVLLVTLPEELSEPQAPADVLQEDSLGAGEYPGEITPSPEPLTSMPDMSPVSCPVKDLPLLHDVSQNGWLYVKCVEEGLLWMGGDGALDVTVAARHQLYPKIRQGLFLCDCQKPSQLKLSKSERNFTHCFLACRDGRTGCRFF